MSETMPHTSQSPEQVLPPFDVQAKEAVLAMQGKVPEHEEFLQLRALADQMDEKERGHFTGPAGEEVDQETARGLREMADERRWLLSEPETKTFIQLRNAERVAELPKHFRDIVRKSKLDPMEPDHAALDRFKTELGQRLALSEALRDDNRQDAKRHGESLRTEREQLLARKEEARARQEVRDHANAHAEQVLGEMEAHRTQRKAANERVERILYQKKLHNGGELALARDPELAERLKREAIDQAAAEGFETAQLRPKHVEAVRRPGAEARQASLVEALRAHDKRMLTGQRAADADKPAVSAEADERVSIEELLEPVTEPGRAGMRARLSRMVARARTKLRALDEKFVAFMDKSMIEDYSVPAAEKPSLKHRAKAKADDLNRRFTGYMDSKLIEDYSAPAKEPRTRRSLRQAGKDAYYHLGTAHAKLVDKTAAKLTEMSEYYADTQAGKRRRVLAGVAGGMAVLGIAMLSYKGIDTQDQLAQAATGQELGGDIGLGGSGVPAELQAVSAETVSPPLSVRLEAGSNPWEVSRHQLELHGVTDPSNAQIAEYNQRLLELNELTETEATTLPSGTKLKLPARK